MTDTILPFPFHDANFDDDDDDDDDGDDDSYHNEYDNTVQWLWQFSIRYFIGYMRSKWNLFCVQNMFLTKLSVSIYPNVLNICCNVPITYHTVRGQRCRSTCKGENSNLLWPW